MKNLKFLIASIIILLYSSCIPSLHSIVTEESIYFDDELIGKWVNTNDDTLIVTRNGVGELSAKNPTNYYSVVLIEELFTDYSVTEFSAELTKIDGQNYIDLTPTNDSDCEQVIPTHYFAKYYFVNNLLTIQLFDSDHIEKLMQEKRIRLKHEIIEDVQLLLTAPTKELRKFLAKYGSDDKFFTNPMEYERII